MVLRERELRGMASSDLNASVARGVKGGPGRRLVRRFKAQPGRIL